jgi:hypothetical protein
MKLYVNKNNPEQYQIGASFENAVLAPENITLSDLPFVSIEEVITEELRGEVVEQIVNYNFTVNGEAKAAASLVKSKQAQVSEAYNVMDNAVYTEMANVFGTTKSDSATVFYETWKLMKEKPSLFVNKVVVDKNIAGYVLGQVLSVESDIQAYADARINEAEAYSVFRLEKINEFYAQRALILGE